MCFVEKGPDATAGSALLNLTQQGLQRKVMSVGVFTEKFRKASTGSQSQVQRRSRN